MACQKNRKPTNKRGSIYKKWGALALRYKGRGEKEEHAMTHWLPSQLLLQIPDSVLSGSALITLPPRKLGLAAMACVKLRRCAKDVAPQMARKSVNLEPRNDDESVGDLLFAVHVLSLATATTTAVAYAHTAVVITSTGELFTFGQGAEGKLGHGSENGEWRPRRVEALVGKRVVQVSCGWSHTAVVTSEGELLTFGYGFTGRLGHDRLSEHEWVPRRVKETLVEKCVVQVSCGYEHTAVITSEGELFTFGREWPGKLGHDFTSRRLPHSEWVPRRVEAFVGKRMVQVACGHNHTAVIASTGELFTFGIGDYGKLGHGSEENELVPRRVDKLMGKRVVQVSSCRNHTAVIASTGELLTFGEGEFGQLGHGGKENELVPRRVEALMGKRVVRVSCGDTCTAVLTSEGELFTFGIGECERLGNGDNEANIVSVPRRVVGMQHIN